MAKALGIELPPLQTFADLSDDQFAAICAQIETTLKAVTNGIVSPTIPSYDIQIESYRLWREQFGPELT